MKSILDFFYLIGFYTIFITPLTLIVGLINAIKKPKEEAKPYTIMAVVSAYLIIMPIIDIFLRL